MKEGLIDSGIVLDGIGGVLVDIKVVVEDHGYQASAHGVVVNGRVIVTGFILARILVIQICLGTLSDSKVQIAARLTGERALDLNMHVIYTVEIPSNFLFSLYVLIS